MENNETIRELSTVLSYQAGASRHEFCRQLAEEIEGKIALIFLCLQFALSAKSLLISSLRQP